MSTGRLVQEFRDGLNRLTMANFLRLLNEHVEAYLRTAFQYPISQKKVVPLFRFFLRLVISRCRNFVRQIGCEESGVPGLNISQVQENYVATLVEKQLSNPYFARLDFKEDGENATCPQFSLISISSSSFLLSQRNFLCLIISLSCSSLEAP